ncbi:sulfide/dihydroorotate dehydrogenase-like FAD/NAD-binding protein [Crateriforma conspicua]|uniref:Dihydroorotate dehydrogenase B (NAD(+)), electron transfer subunit n=1 Tax=Crateriforma conspicua TaxID=2527996 RepID=A0A5C5Y5N3_9PLAN|nr:sulfide/dihydroorotate dehydrogenase-like FAD/NAD-binding protein [Crateriforma conspicua]QDV65598.1 Dihydroorotate dehydrogenase B (NAD(+)), electron transfer subunit [Crateriforma conspicua]TWT70997.1 Dihydroorotate dehydrogenase B (NAD(+)), electron transfer subunit [Crateriforma conspicua]
MFPIVEARFLAPDVKLFRIQAPRIARKRRAGQFVIIRIDEHGERIPLTIADSDQDGNITIIVQGVGKTTRWLNTLESGDAIRDVVGPLGEPSEVESFGTVVVIGGGVGTAIAYPTAVAMKQAGNRVISIIGARDHERLILQDAMQQTSDQLHVMTDDGSAGTQGFVTDALDQMIQSGVVVDRVLAIGPVPMMRAVSAVTKPHQIPTIVSLNPIMVDGTGMCGGCRVLVGGRARFACVDGPEFDAHEVDFDVLMKRNNLYRDQEAEALREFDEHPPESVTRSCQLQHHHPEVGPRSGDDSRSDVPVTSPENS